jgi:hypothetical protein
LKRDFALTPDDGPPRILRFAGAGDMPTGNTLCVLDEANNVLTINKVLFDRLPRMEQHQVERTHAVQIDIHRWSQAA